ncbi:MAG TPA: glycoside hydrolase domain-containing protein, partial [Bacteroidia bacterium]|nr:glycoside hydrolase domain-containing protein [Bacteroidia bacterium]
MTNTTVLPGTVQAAAPNSNGFDTVSTISPTVATAFINSGYSFCIRYLSLGATQQDLSYNEALGILNAGLALSVVQRTWKEFIWTANAQLGTSTGANAANNAKSIGLPQGMVVWCDLETPDPASGAQGVIDFCQAWYAQVKAAGYVPGLYVGAGCLLTSQQLY